MPVNSSKTVLLLVLIGCGKGQDQETEHAQLRRARLQGTVFKGFPPECGGVPVESKSYQRNLGIPSS